MCGASPPAVSSCAALSRSVVPGSCVTPWTVTQQAPLSMGSPRQESWSELPFPSPGGLPDPGIELSSPSLQVDSLPLAARDAG